MSAPSFAISLLNGELKSASFRRGAITGSWLRTEPLTDLAALPEALQEAVGKAQPATKRTALVFADARLSDHFIELPQAKGATLVRLLDRAANRVKAFQGDIAWSSQPAIPRKNGSTALLHICPKPLLDQLLQSCHAANLELARLLPTTAVLASHLKALPIQKDEIGLIIAQSGLSTTIVAGRKDGRLCLGRILPVTWKTAPDRVWMDVMRSINFAEQQVGVSISSVWLFGEGAEGQIASAQAAIKAPVKASPVLYTPAYWAEQAATLPEKEDGNLLSDEIRAAPAQQRFMTVTAMLVVLLLLGSGAVAGTLEYFRNNELKGLEQVKRQIGKIQIEKAEVEKTHAEMELMKKATEYIEAEPPPAPGWFLAHLGQVLPPEMAVTKLRVLRTNNAWTVHLAGTTESRSNIVQTFDGLCRDLASGAFKLTITESDIGVPPPPPVRTAPGQTVPPPRPVSKLLPNTFVINGVMR